MNKMALETMGNKTTMYQAGPEIPKVKVSMIDLI